MCANNSVLYTITQKWLQKHTKHITQKIISMYIREQYRVLHSYLNEEITYTGTQNVYIKEQYSTQMCVHI